MSITLRPYRSSDATTITSWIKSEYLMRQWCADRYEHYPVTPKDMNSYHENYIDGDKSRVLTMCDGDEILGYITLRTAADNPSERRIGFVIVDDSKRGTGLGKVLVSMAVDYAFEELCATKVSLGVFENNLSAIHCFEAAGFHRVSRPEVEKYECLGETWNCIEMERYSDMVIREMIAVKRGKTPSPYALWYLDAVEEALCFGWIDSTLKNVGGVSLQRFGPRSKSGRWTELNKGTLPSS